LPRSQTKGPAALVEKDSRGGAPRAVERIHTERLATLEVDKDLAEVTLAAS